MPFRASLGFMALLAAGIGSAVPAQTQTAPVSVALDSRALGQHAAWYVALEKGYYKNAGLNVTIVPNQGGAEALKSLETKTAQFAFADVAGLATAHAAGQTAARMVAVIYQKAPYAVFTLRSGANLTRADQLENLEIGSAPGSLGPKVIEAFMKSKPLKAETVKYISVDPQALIAAMAGKKVPAIEAFAMSMPGVLKAAGAHDAQIFLLSNAGLSLYGNGIIVRDDYLQAEPAKVKAFVRASLQGWKDTIANPKDAAGIVGKHAKGIDADALFQGDRHCQHPRGHA